MQNSNIPRASLAASLLTLLASGATLIALHLKVDIMWLIIAAAIAVLTAAACVLLNLSRFTAPALAGSPPIQYAPPAPASLPQPALDAPSSNPLDNRQWVSLVEECVELYDEFERHKTSFDDSSRELAEHTNARLQEILERAGVETIASDSNFDPRRHKAKNTISAEATGDALIAETISPGFAIGPRVLRRAHVRLTEKVD
jgi:hypothetical protein